jgi:hypothetical protein
MKNYCAGCGMITLSPTEYHPFGACAMFKILLSSDQARQSLRAIVEYGMQAERQGLTLDQATGDISLHHHDDARPANAAPTQDHKQENK